MARSTSEALTLAWHYYARVACVVVLGFGSPQEIVAADPSHSERSPCGERRSGVPMYTVTT